MDFIGFHKFKFSTFYFDIVRCQLLCYEVSLQEIYNSKTYIIVIWGFVRILGMQNRIFLH
jgi:hypothetical protein